MNQVVKQLPHMYGITFGADPECFLSRMVGKVRKRRSIVGSEVVVPASGSGGVARDGVQVELHPHATTCRANFSGHLAGNIRQLKDLVDEHNRKNNDTIQIDLTPVVRVSKGDLAKMSPDCRKLGCLPSFNAYGRKRIEKDGEKFLIRSAAGHLHAGTPIFHLHGAEHKPRVDPNVYAKICDVIIGNTCVMVDRSPLASERRKTYGKAGEYRLPKHGFEYRTLSNFWLHNYVLMSMVFSLLRVAHDVACSTSTVRPSYLKEMPTTMWPNAADMLMKDVDQRKIEEAINTNNWELAKDNYERWVRPFFEKLEYHETIGVDHNIVKDFDYFLSQFRQAETDGVENPLTAWFTEDPIAHWLSKGDGHGKGFESFMRNHVRPKRPVQFSGFVMYSGEGIKAPEPVQPTITPVHGDAVGARVV